MNVGRPLAVLVYGLPLLVVMFGVFMGGYALSSATRDEVGAILYFRVAMVCLMLLAGNMVLLVGILGIHALSRSDRHTDESSDRPDPSS